MPFDPVKIPQNVYVEDRIIGPLTLRQMIIMLLGGGFSYVLWAMIARSTGGQVNIVVTVIAWIPFAISVIFALVKINDLSLIRICLLLIESMSKPRIRIWTPRQGLTIHIRTAKHLEKKEKERGGPREIPENLRELSSVLDRSLRIIENQGEDVHPQPSTLPPATEAPMGSASNAAQGTTNDVPEAASVIPAAPRLPVHPERIQAEPLNGSNLQVFRDVFPHSAS